MNFKKGVASTLNAVLISGILVLPTVSFSQSSTPSPSAPPPGNWQNGQNGQGGQHQGGMHHPAIKKALHQLERIKAQLAKDPHDFGGHKANAMNDIQQAIGELQQALQSAQQQH